MSEHTAIGSLVRMSHVQNVIFHHMFRVKVLEVPSPTNRPGAIQRVKVPVFSVSVQCDGFRFQCFFLPPSVLGHGKVVLVVRFFAECHGSLRFDARRVHDSSHRRRLYLWNGREREREKERKERGSSCQYKYKSRTTGSLVSMCTPGTGNNHLQIE